MPIPYICKKCEKGDRKLWRLSQTFLEHQELLCIDCLCKETGLDRASVTADGRRPYPKGHLTDQMPGSRIPAVPTPDGETFWGYTSVPEEGVTWWKQLSL